MRFAGIGVEWERQEGGLAPLEWNGGSLHLKALDVAGEMAAVKWTGPDAVVGIGAPAVAFDKSKVSGMGRLLRALARCRILDGGRMAAREEGRWRVEVHPYAAADPLFRVAPTQGRLFRDSGERARSEAGSVPARRAALRLSRRSLSVWGPYA